MAGPAGTSTPSADAALPERSAWSAQLYMRQDLEDLVINSFKQFLKLPCGHCSKAGACERFKDSGPLVVKAMLDAFWCGECGRLLCEAHRHDHTCERHDAKKEQLATMALEVLRARLVEERRLAEAIELAAKAPERAAAKAADERRRRRHTIARKASMVSEFTQLCSREGGASQVEQDELLNLFVKARALTAFLWSEFESPTLPDVAEKEWGELKELYSRLCEVTRVHLAVPKNGDWEQPDEWVEIDMTNYWEEGCGAQNELVMVGQTIGEARAVGQALAAQHAGGARALAPARRPAVAAAAAGVAARVAAGVAVAPTAVAGRGAVAAPRAAAAAAATLMAGGGAAAETEAGATPALAQGEASATEEAAATPVPRDLSVAAAPPVTASAVSRRDESAQAVHAPAVGHSRGLGLTQVVHRPVRGPSGLGYARLAGASSLQAARGLGGGGGGASMSSRAAGLSGALGVSFKGRGIGFVAGAGLPSPGASPPPRLATGAAAAATGNPGVVAGARPAHSFGGVGPFVDAARLRGSPTAGAGYPARSMSGPAPKAVGPVSTAARSLAERWKLAIEYEQFWMVVGGADSGGILVREGESLKSGQVSARLATGAIVKELLLKGERLHYNKVSGDGPQEGWVSLKAKGRDLLRHTTANME